VVPPSEAKKLRAFMNQRGVRAYEIGRIENRTRDRLRFTA